jgi:DNA-binding MarR family transcriptional regulator
MPRRNPGPQYPSDVAARGDTRRHKILEYLAGQGGELRSDSGTGLRRQIADALGERPTAVGQSLVSLEKAGLVDRELDVQRQRCYAIRLTPDAQPLRPEPQARAGHGSPWDVDLAEPPERATEMSEQRRRLAADLDAARQELKDAILTATRVSRRVKDLEWALWRAGERQPVSP